MMKRKSSRQSWWPLYGLGLMMIGLLFLARNIVSSSGWRIFLQIGVVIVGYGLILVWVETHPGILLKEPPAGADDPKVKLPQPSHGRREFHSDFATFLIEGRPEQSNSKLSPNGHGHLSRMIPSRPEETDK